MNEISDAELVRGALAGEEEQCRALVERYQRPVMSLILRMVRDRGLAEDLTQEVFVKAFRHLGRYDPSRRLASWLFKIAHNATLDHLRRRRLDTVELEDGDKQGLGLLSRLALPEEQGPEHHAVRGELLGDLEQALGQLATHYREVLLLRFREEMSYQEIADITGLALGTVKIQIHRGRKQLAAALEEMGWKAPERFRER